MIPRIALLLAALAPTAIGAVALAQPADCPARPVGPPMDLHLWVGNRGGTPATAQGNHRPAPPEGGVGVTFRDVPSYGTACDAPPPPADVLHGTPGDPQGGLLRDRPPADILRGP